MSDDILSNELTATAQPSNILPIKATDFLRTKPRKPASVRGLKRDWSVIPGVGYRMDIRDIAVTFDVSRVRTKFDEIWGLLTVRVQFAGAKVVDDNILSMGDFSFSSMRSRHERSIDLEKRSCAPDIDWRWLIEELCIRVLDYEGRGDQEISLADVKRPDKEHNPEIIAAGMPLLRHHPSIWFGDGGSAKSMLALYAAIDLAESGYRVLYCDWELTAEEHAKRAREMYDGIARLSDSLFYRRCNRPFVDDILPIRDIIAKRNIQFLICDSLSFGAKPPIESSESALNYQQALRACGDIGSLHIAHINRSADTDKRPFGSTYWHNMARATWFLKNSDTNGKSLYSNEMTVICEHKKHNLTQKRPTFAVRLTFGQGQIQIGPGIVTEDEADTIKNLTIDERVLLALRGGEMTQIELCNSLASTFAVGSVQTRIRALKTANTIESVLDDRGIRRIRLVASV